MCFDRVKVWRANIIYILDYIESCLGLGIFLEIPKVINKNMYFVL